MHELKILKSYFDAVASGYKTFEVRKDDRGFQKGDSVILREYDPKKSPGFMYSGRVITATIGYVTAYEQQKGYVVFSLLNVEQKET